MEANEQSAYEIAAQFHEAWQNGDWAALRATLADQAELESPALGRIVGAYRVVAAYRDEARFAGVTSVAERRTAVTDNVVFRSYDVYLGLDRKATVVDQYTVREG